EEFRCPLPACDAKSKDILWQGLNGGQIQPPICGFDRGHVLGSAGEMYFEVFGRCRIRLARDAGTWLSQDDHADFNVPAVLAGQHFRSISELQRRIVSIREADDGGDGPRRLSQQDELLMRAIFQHHPKAARKLKDLQFIQVGPSSKSNDPRHRTFSVMRSEQDGEDISYVSCLRCLAEEAAGRIPTERLVSLASITNGHELKLQIGTDSWALGEAVDSLGVRVDLERRQLFLHLSSSCSGPWPLNHAATANLTIVADEPRAEIAIHWVGPFRLRTAAVGSGATATVPIRQSLERLMQEEGVPGDLSTLSSEEVHRIAGQALVRCLGSSLQVARSRRGAAAQKESLLRMAKGQVQEVTHEQLLQAKAELQEARQRQEVLEAANAKLREDALFCEIGAPHP
ncbi:unnamed protein product, partial [Effrenium voratum]